MKRWAMFGFLEVDVAHADLLSLTLRTNFSEIRPEKLVFRGVYKGRVPEQALRVCSGTLPL